MANIRKTFNFREGVKVDDSVLVVAGQRVGIGSTVPTKVLDIKGDVISSGQVTVSKLFVNGGISTFSDVKIGTGITIQSSSGIITASKFFGDGSTLSNLPTSQWTDTDIGLGFTSIYNEGNVGVGTTDPRFTFQVGSNPNTVGKKGVGINSLSGDIKTSGIVTALKFVGDGSLLENLPAGAIGGTVELANIANYAHVAGIATVAQGLTGTPNIVVGFVTSSGAKFTGIVTAPTFVGDLSGTATQSTETLNLNSETNYSINSDKILSAGIGSFGKVGIGTTNPEGDLQIVNSGGSQVFFGKDINSTGNNGSIKFGRINASFPYSTSSSLDILNYGSGNINFYLEAGSIGINTGDFHWHRRGNFDRLMTLTYKGSLGIGQTQPVNTLHVVGTSTVTSNAFFGNDVTIAGDASIAGALTFGTANFGVLVADRVNAGIFSGNVYAESGISTFKNLKVTGTSELQGGIGIGTTAREELLNGNPRFPVSINPQDDKRILINSTGQIGIRTTEISSSIDVDAIECVAIFGVVGVGTTIPGKAAVDFSDAGKIGAATTSNRFMLPPVLTGSERSSIYQLQEGAFIYNSDNNRIEVYNGTSWQPASAGGASGISAVVDDPTPQLGGNLELNNKIIYGTGGINITGVATFASEIDANSTLNVAQIATFQENVNLGVNKKVSVGSAATVLDASGQLHVSANNFQLKSLLGETQLTALANNSVSLYFDNNRKLYTTGYGVSVVGTFDANALRGSLAASYLTGSLPAIDGSALLNLTGATGGTYGSSTEAPVITVDSNGRITGISQATISGGGGGDITGVTAGTGLSGGGTTGDVTLNLANTSVSAGSYTNTDITVDAQGRITSASNGTGGSGYSNSDVDTHLNKSSATTGEILSWNGADYDWVNPNYTGGITKCAIIQDVKSNGVGGGSTTVNQWLPRDLNTEIDPQSFVTLSSLNGYDYFSLPAGTYKIKWECPAFQCGLFQTRLAISGDTAFNPGYTTVLGASQYSGNSNDPGGGNYSDANTLSNGEHVLTTTTTTYFRIEQNIRYNHNSNSTTVLGTAASRGNNEVYTRIGIEDLATAVKNSGNSVFVKHDSANIGIATVIDFTTNLDVTPVHAGIVTVTASGGGGGGGTVSSGNFTAQVGTPATLETYAYDSAELVFEYTVFVKNSTNYQSQKLLVMRDGTTVTSTQYGVMFSNTLLVQLDATISGSNLLLRATPESGVTGTTTYRIKREVT